MTSGYKTIDAMIETVKEKFGKEHKISVMFENCISNTLSTTIKTLDDGSVFVITGEIPAASSVRSFFSQRKNRKS